MKTFTGVSVLALCAATTPAFAELSPQQVWDEINAYAEIQGYAITAVTEQSGDTLRLSDVTYVIQIPEEEMDISVMMGDLDLIGNGDGSVTMDFPDQSQMIVEISEGGEAGQILIDMGIMNDVIAISGSPENMIFDYTIEKMTLALSDVIEPGGDSLPEGMLSANIALGPIAVKGGMQRMADMLSATQNATYGDLSYNVAFNDPDSEDAGSFTGGFKGIFANSEAAMPEGMSFADPLALFQQGFGLIAKMGHAGGSHEFAVTERRGATTGAVSSTSGEFALDLSDAGLTYSVSGSGTKLDLQSHEIPLPISAEMAESGFSLTVPLKSAETPQDAKIEVLLGGFKMADLLWGLFDPAGNLPRDPATISVALDAKVTPFIDLIDIEAMEELERSGEMPGELNSVTLRKLLVEAVGGKISGEGAFTFDNSDLESFDGLPRPEGALDLQVVGANGLIDKMIAMGFVEEGDAMGARMMMGMFAVPGEGEDTLNSKIEVNAEGHVLANGQRLK